MKILFFIISFLIIFGAYSQQAWSLNRCIDSAIENNNNMRSVLLNQEKINIDLATAKHSFLPSLNGGATHGYNWGQTIDLFTNQFATNRVQYNNFYFSSSLILFSGLQKYYHYKSTTIDKKSNQYNLELQKRIIKQEIATAYLQVLLNNEMVLVNKQRLANTKEIKEQTKELIQEEYLPQSKLLEINAQYEESKHQVLKAKNDYQYSIVLLQQLMNRHYDSTFVIQPIDLIDDYSLDNNYKNAPEIKLSQLAVNQQKIKIKQSKGAYLPTLSINGSVGSGFSENNKLLNQNGELITKPFRNQLGENFYESAYLSLIIPLYNNNSKRNLYQKSIISLEQKIIDKEKIELELANKITQLQLDIKNYKSQYHSIFMLLSAQKSILQEYKSKYKQGYITYRELQEIEVKVYQTNSELIQTKYNLFMSIFFLKLYNE